MRFSLGLTQKLLGFVTLLVVCLVLVTVGLANSRARRLAGENIRRGLSSAQGAWETFEADRYAKLKLAVRVLANDPYFKAAVQTTDHATILDMLGERGRDLEADFFIATDSQGYLLARTDRPEAYGDDMVEAPVVAQALDGEEAATLWRQGDRLFHAVSVPMITGPEFVGVLVAGHAIEEQMAAQLERLTSCDVVFVVPDDDAGGLRLSVSSLDRHETDLREVVAGEGVPLDQGATPFPLGLGDEDFLGVATPLVAASGERVATLLALRSLTVELASFRAFRTSLLLAALVVMVMALGIGYVAANRLARPMRRLVTLVEKARDGSYSGAVQVETSDEVGVLARAFSGLLADLHEKEQLIAFLREGRGPLRRGAASPAEAETVVVDPYAQTVAGPPGTGQERTALEGLLGGRYEIQDVLGRGGMGVVYRAYDRRLDETVALKVLRTDLLETDPQLFERFKQEIKLARRVTHRNVLRTFDLDEIEGMPCISMEYVDGVSLKDLVELKGALPLPVGLRVAKEMCHALDAAHREGVVHRDIKPQNMIIMPESGELKIMDFGVAGVSNVKGAGGLTAAGMVMGTPHYMSPEQAQARPADARSDIYSLGIVFFEIFTGRLPFVADSVIQVVVKHVQERPPDPRSVNPSIPVGLEAIILACLEKDPTRRPQDVAEILAALTKVSSEVEGRRAA